MTPGGADGQRGNGKGKGISLPSDYVHPGGGRTNMRDANTLGGSLSGSPALNAAASGQPLDAESLKAEVETLRLCLTAQQATNRSLAEANNILIASVEALRQEDIESDARAAKSRRRTKSKTKVKIDPKRGESSSSRPETVDQATERRDGERKLRKMLRKIREETKLARSTSSVENANMAAANESSWSSGATSSSSSDMKNPRAPRLLRRRAQAPSPRTRHRTPRLDNSARVGTRVAPNLRSGWRKPIGKRSFDPLTVASSLYWTIAPNS